MQIHPAHASAQSGVWSQPCNFPATACCCEANPQQPRVVKACLWEEPSVPTMMGKLKCCDASQTNLSPSYKFDQVSRERPQSEAAKRDLSDVTRKGAMFN